jgi:hypothetical protein
MHHFASTIRKYEVFRKIDQNIPWAGAPYSTTIQKQIAKKRDFQVLMKFTSQVLTVLNYSIKLKAYRIILINVSTAVLQ